MKTRETAQIPKYQHRGDSGFDFHAAEDVMIHPGVTKLIPTGLAFQIPQGLEIQVRPRSGMSLKTAVRISNSPGTVDSSYTGEVKIIMQNTGSDIFYINVGDRIAQGVICPVIRANFIEVDKLDDTDRSAGGFGSTGI